MSEFAFPDNIPVDTAHTLDQLTGRFRGVREGLPELVKNAKDQYSRLGVLERKQRQIIVLSSAAKRCIGVLDFAGARHEDFEGWTTWSSRFAGRADMADDIEAGHGNGGKAFMVRGATQISYLESCFGGRRTRMGFRNDIQAARYKPGYAKASGSLIQDVSETSPEKRLSEFLKNFNIKVADLPEPARKVFETRQAFTGVYLSQVTDWQDRWERTIKRLATDGLAEILASHGQTSMSIETCQVWVMSNDGVVGNGPIAALELEPYPDFEDPTVISVPKHLVDPETRERVEVWQSEPEGNVLVLRTTRRQLQMSDDTKARNVIRVWNTRNNVATWPMQSIGVLITSVSFLYGELRCPALVGDHLAGSERVNLAETPLVRALRDWTRVQVEALAELLHRAMMAESRPKDRAQANSALRGIRDLMRKYLDPEAAGATEEERGDPGGIGGGPGPTRTREPTAYGSRIEEIVLESGAPSISIAWGSRVPLLFRALDKAPDGTPLSVREPVVQLRCEPPDLVSLDAQRRLLGQQAGLGRFWLESGSIRSNDVDVQVVKANGVDITPPDEPLLQGQRLKLPILFRTDDGPRDDLLIESTVDEPGMGLIGRNGRFTAGLRAGQATVRVRFGAAPLQQAPAIIQIGPDRVPVSGHGSAGPDIPEILLCGDEAPGMEEYPAAQRSHSGGEEQPTIIEEPQFRNVVWINPSSKEAMRVRGSRGGPSGIGGIATANFMHFVALKCFDVLKRLYVRQQIRDRTVTETEFVQLTALAEVECADFIDAAWVLSETLVRSGGANG